MGSWGSSPQVCGSVSKWPWPSYAGPDTFHGRARCWVAAGVGLAGLFTAFTVNTSDLPRPVVVGNFITMPLMFASTALSPRQFLPERLKATSAVNPLTYLTELGRDAVTYGTLIYLTAFSAALTLVERLLTAD